MLEIAILSATLLAALVVYFLLRLRGHRVTSATLNLPFAQLNMQSFNGLSPVRRFQEISMFCIQPMENGEPITESRPIILIHVGWNVVCNAFVERFRRYPDDETLNAAAGELGGQNVEFIRMYREIYGAAIKDADSVAHKFASNYLVRAPSLAERIAEKSPRTDDFLNTYLNEAQRGIRAE